MDVKYKYRQNTRNDGTMSVKDQAVSILWPLAEEKIYRNVFNINRSKPKKSGLRTEDLSIKELESLIGGGLADYLRALAANTKLWSLAEKFNFENNLREIFKKKGRNHKFCSIKCSKLQRNESFHSYCIDCGIRIWKGHERCGKC